MKILFTGDFLISKQPSMALLKQYSNLFSSYDHVIANFEGPLVSSDSSKSMKAGAHLQQSPDSLEVLKQINISAVNLANNHILDYGIDGLRHTIDSLKKSSINFFGAHTDAPEVYSHLSFNDNDINVGILGLSEMEFGVVNSSDKIGGVAWINDVSVNNLLTKLKENHQFVFVLAHAGIEHTPVILPIWRKRYHQLIDLGADLVIGNHPHLIQGYEVYKGKYIFYSLGDFIFEGKNSQSLLVDVSVNKNGLRVKKRIVNHKRIYSKLETELYFKHLNQYIKLDEKSDELMKLSQKKWSELYFPLFWRAIVITLLLKVIPSNIFRLQKKAYLFLLHNIKIESHRYLIESYLQKLINN